MNKPSYITPPIGIAGLLRQFGGMRHLQSAATAMGLKITFAQIRDWMARDAMPDYIYHALGNLISEDELKIAKGFIEFYVRGEPIGKFYLHKDVTAVIRKRRN